MKAKVEERACAREMRHAGVSIKRIANELKCSQGSVSSWVKDIPLSPEVCAELRSSSYGNRSCQKASETMRSNASFKRQAWRDEGRERAKEKDWRHVMACGLYWAEGEKGRNSMRFSNTDPLMVKLFYDFLLAEFPQEKVVIHFYYHDDLENSPPEEARSFWAKLLGLGESSVRSYKNTDARPRSGVKKNRHKHGICTLTVHSTRVVQHIYGALDEYAGVDVGKK